MAVRASFRILHKNWLRALVVGLAITVPLSAASAFTLFELPGIQYATSAEPGNVNGVDPDSGTSGTLFRFYVNYVDLAASAPSQAKLKIDLDGNGIAGGVVTPFAQPRWPNYLLAALVGVWLLTWLLANRMPRWRPAFSAAGVALALLLVTIGCGGSSGSGGSALASHAGLASCSAPPGESMDMVDPGGDYSTGVVFTKDVTLTCQPGIVLFMFDFKNSVGGSMNFGSAPNLHTLVINP